MVKRFGQYEHFVRHNEIEVTVFIVTYNRSAFLRETIVSILEQTYFKIAVVIVDNDSTDNTEEVVDEFLDERLFYYKQRENIGGIGNINTAFQLACTDYVMVFHDDDQMDSRLVETELNEIKKFELTAVSSSAKMINENGNEINIGVTIGHDFTGFQYFEHVIKYGNSAIFPSVLYRTKFLREKSLCLNAQAGPCCDFYFLSEICVNGGRFRILGERLVVRKVHKNQDSSRSEFWMNIQVLNYFCSNQRYKKSIINYQNYVIRGYIKNIRHLAANLHERKVGIEKYKEVLGLIPIYVFSKGFSRARLKFWLFNANHNRLLFSFFCHAIRKTLRFFKKKDA